MWPIIFVEQVEDSAQGDIDALNRCLDAGLLDGDLYQERSTTANNILHFARLAQFALQFLWASVDGTHEDSTQAKDAEIQARYGYFVSPVVGQMSHHLSGCRPVPAAGFETPNLPQAVRDQLKLVQETAQSRQATDQAQIEGLTAQNNRLQFNYDQLKDRMHPNQPDHTLTSTNLTLVSTKQVCLFCCTCIAFAGLYCILRQC